MEVGVCFGGGGGEGGFKAGMLSLGEQGSNAIF